MYVYLLIDFKEKKNYYSLPVFNGAGCVWGYEPPYIKCIVETVDSPPFLPHLQFLSRKLIPYLNTLFLV